MVRVCTLMQSCPKVVRSEGPFRKGSLGDLELQVFLPQSFGRRPVFLEKKVRFFRLGAFHVRETNV